MEEPTLVWDDTASTTPNANNNAAADLMNKIRYKNGEKSTEKGPCPCGYRHWVDGKVYDFVFHLDARRPETAIGFNLGDNATATAEDFVERKGGLGLGFKTKEFVNQVANFIRSSLIEEGYEEAMTRDDWDPTKPMKLRLGEEGRVVNGKKLTFEIGDIVRADQKAAAQQREEEARKEADKKKLALENEKKTKQDINRQREDDHLEREKNREWQEQLKALNADIPILGSEKTKKWMINGVLTDVTVEQYVKLKELSQENFASPDAIESVMNEKRTRGMDELETGDDEDVENMSELKKALLFQKQLETLEKLYEMQKGRGSGSLEPGGGKDRGVQCPCGFEKDVKSYLPKEGDPNVGVKNVAALLHLKGEAETKKWLAEHGADNKKIAEALDMAKHCLKTHKLKIYVYDPNAWMQGAANSIAGSTSSAGTNTSSSSSTSTQAQQVQSGDGGAITKTKKSTAKRAPLRWEPRDDFKIVVGGGEKTKLKIILMNNPKPLVLEVNLSHTLQDLHDHVRNVSGVGNSTDFDLAKKDAAQTEILLQFEKTVGELKLKNQVIVVMPRD